MRTISKNKKLNAALNGIYSQMLNICDNELESVSTVKRYKNDFKNVIDFNIYSYGNVLIYFYDIRNFYILCGYKAKNWSDEKVCNIYKRQIRYIANNLF